MVRYLPVSLTLRRVLILFGMRDSIVGIRGKIYDLIKPNYRSNRCAVKFGERQSQYFTQERGVHQGCNLSLMLVNIFINELASKLEKSPCPGISLQIRR